MANELLQELRRKTEQGGGAEKVDEQHKKNKLIARERIGLLLDGQSFLETDVFAAGTTGVDAPGEGVVTGFGTVNGRPVYVYAQDFTVLGGSVGAAHAAKISRVMDQAAKVGAPVVALLDSAGARLQEGFAALAGYGEIYRRAARIRGAVPQIGVVCGPCIGAAAYGAALMDFVFLAGKAAQMQTWGPQVAEASMGKIASAVAAGSAQFACETEEEAFAQVKALLALLPANSAEDAPASQWIPDLNREATALDGYAPGTYDMKTVVGAIADEGSFFATSDAFAPTMLTGFVRIGGRTVGVVASNPSVDEGKLTGDACAKAARHIDFCDGFHIPVLTLVDTAGLPACANEENGGLISAGSDLIAAYAQATTPKITVFTGRATGSAFAILGNRSLGIDTVYAWQSAELSVVAPETAVAILGKDELAKADDPVAERAKLIEKYKAKDANPIEAAKAGLLDDVIQPSQTRVYVAAALEMLIGKRDAGE